MEVSMSFRVYYAKIGKSNSLAEAYLSGHNELSQPAVPIYFNKKPSNREDFLNNDKGQSREQGRNFFDCADNPNTSLIIVLNAGKCRILKPVGQVVFLPASGYESGDYVKLLPVELIKEFSVCNIPAVLSGITSNTYFYTGTFREITDPGCLAAIDYLMGKSIGFIKRITNMDFWQCLGSVELETLIAKIFEEKGCFVPAYRGGTKKDIDIVAHNETESDIEVGHIKLEKGKAISIQVKRKCPDNSPPEGCDYLVSFSDANHTKAILEALKTTPKTLKWLRRSLQWLPAAHNIC